MKILRCAKTWWNYGVREFSVRFTGDLQRPVENVSWHDTQEFLRKLMEKERGRTYRFPKYVKRKEEGDGAVTFYVCGCVLRIYPKEVHHAQRNR